MYAHPLMRLARRAVRGRRTVQFRAFGLFWLVLAVIGLGACSTALAESPTPHPADPDARVRPAPYRSVTSGYVSRRPVEPQPWRGRNDAVAPQEKK
jgi:hypothetical protein